jgi:hypothetical protein
MRSPFSFQRYLFWRGFRIAPLLRLAMVAVVLLSAAVTGSPVEFSSALAPALVALTVLVGWIESWRVSEQVLLANLGASPIAQSLWLGMGAMIAEAALAALLMLVRVLVLS